jgi:ATP-dependent RNA helicase RhlE
MEQLMREKISGVTALVLVPTRELAMQVANQYDALRGRQLPPAAVVVGGLADGPQLAALRRGARLVVATPGRLEDFLERKDIDFRALRMLVLDEADRMLDVGFLPAIRRIVAVLPRHRQTMCFSATLEGDVARLVADCATARILPTSRKLEQNTTAILRPETVNNPRGLLPTWELRVPCLISR